MSDLQPAMFRGCKDCIYFKERYKLKPAPKSEWVMGIALQVTREPDGGTCHFYPPTKEHNFPRVREDDFCREHQTIENWRDEIS